MKEYQTKLESNFKEMMKEAETKPNKTVNK
jgi:hypothetical protein